MTSASLLWERFPNFFRLREHHMRTPQLIYVIGEAPFCYIGSIGSDEGQEGIGTRYQAQYLKLGKAIFGLPEESGKSCYAATITVPDAPTPSLIYAIEAEVQGSFISHFGSGSALFKPIGRLLTLTLTHDGERPSFL